MTPLSAHVRWTDCLGSVGHTILGVTVWWTRGFSTEVEFLIERMVVVFAMAGSLLGGGKTGMLSAASTYF